MTRATARHSVPLRQSGMTIGDALHDAVRMIRTAGIETADIDAHVLLAHALGCTRSALLTRRQGPISSDIHGCFQAMVRDRCLFRPVALIIGAKGFWSRDIRVNKHVLIPRPETEGIVERTLKCFPRDASLTILDLCTGSGCIAAALAQEFPRARIVATDISSAALDMARVNCAFAGDRIEFLEGDLFDVFGSRITGHGSRIFDLIVANPPYIPRDEISSLSPDIRLYEPIIALDGGTDGLAILRQIADDAPRHLNAGGFLIVEVGMGQASHVDEFLKATDSFADVVIDRDLAGIERVISARRL